MTDITRLEFETDIILDLVSRGWKEDDVRELYLKKSQHDNDYVHPEAFAKWQGYVLAAKRFKNYRPVPDGIFKVTKDSQNIPDDAPIKLIFPGYLRKMWAGYEVQEWLNNLDYLYDQETLDKVKNKAYHEGWNDCYENFF